MAGMPASGFIAPARPARGGSARRAGDPTDPADPDADARPAWKPFSVPELVFWLGLTSAVGSLAHAMLRATGHAGGGANGAAGPARHARATRTRPAAKGTRAGALAAVRASSAKAL